MKKLLFLLVLAMAAVSFPLTAMGYSMSYPSPTKLDILGNISLDGSYLSFQQGKQNVATVYTLSANDAAWEQFGLGDVNWGKYSALGHGVFEIAGLTTFNWDTSEYGKTPTSFTLDFRNDIGHMTTSLGIYEFDIDGNKKCFIGSNFEAMPSAPVPEPATMLLFGAGLVGLVGARLKKSKKS